MPSKIDIIASKNDSNLYLYNIENCEFDVDQNGICNVIYKLILKKNSFRIYKSNYKIYGSEFHHQSCLEFNNGRRSVVWNEQRSGVGVEY